MPHVTLLPTTQDYAALRQTGTSPDRAMAELRLAPGMAWRFERAFRRRTLRPDGDVQSPRFARHEAHVAAVLAQGGFCAFSERRLAGDGVSVCLPLIWPERAHG